MNKVLFLLFLILQVYSCHLCFRQFTRDYRLKQHYVQDHDATPSVAKQFVIERRVAAAIKNSAKADTDDVADDDNVEDEAAANDGADPLNDSYDTDGKVEDIRKGVCIRDNVKSISVAVERDEGVRSTSGTGRKMANGRIATQYCGTSKTATRLLQERQKQPNSSRNEESHVQPYHCTRLCSATHSPISSSPTSHPTKNAHAPLPHLLTPPLPSPTFDEQRVSLDEVTHLLPMPPLVKLSSLGKGITSSSSPSSCSSSASLSPPSLSSSSASLIQTGAAEVEAAEAILTLSTVRHNFLKS